MIGVVDYGVGNSLAFFNSYKRMNIACKLVSTPDEFADVERVILPGVGSFDFAMSKLKASGLSETLHDLVIDKKAPLLGVCVGMQMLATASDEGELDGLNWVPGNVRQLSNQDAEQAIHLPHMGWNAFSVSRATALFEGIDHNSWFYYLHSFYFECDSEEDEIANCNYGKRFSCAVNRDNIFGVQFHPEKSHEYGSRLLRNFSKI